MSHRLSPILLACVIGLASSSPLVAATASERDQQALAVMQLVQLGMRLPAQRQFDAYRAAGYGDDGLWIEKVLREAFLLRFLAEMPAAGAPLPANRQAAPDGRAALDPTLDKELTDLSAELNAAAKSSTLPAFAKTLRGGGGNSLLRLANELGAIINPNLPRPRVEPAPERLQAATGLAEVLAKTIAEDFATSLAKITAHQADEAHMWDLDDRNPAFHKILSEACDLRIAALSDAYLGVIALREVSMRGTEFGIAPAQTAAQAFLTAFLAKHGATVGQWDFEFGDFTPYIRAYANMLLGEAVRLGLANAKENDVESGLQAVIDFDTRPFQHEMPALLEAYHLKLSAWCQLLRWRLELGNARAVAKGLNAWTDFLNRAQNDAFLRSPGPPRLAAEVGQLSILAARLLHAKGDDAAARILLSHVIAQRPLNPLSENARRWLADFGQIVAGGSWSSVPLAGDPGTAITLARACIAEASATADVARQRANYLDAAVTLRNAVLALGRSPDSTIVDFGPAVYDLYASTLNRLGMRHHALIVSLEGVRTFANYLEDQAQANKPNPWIRNGIRDQWRDDIITPRRLGIDAASYAEALARLDRTAERICADAEAQIARISPSSVPPDLRLPAISNAIDSGDFPGALTMTRDYIAKTPADDLKGYQLLIAIYQRWVASLSKEGGSSATVLRIQDEAAKVYAMILEALAAEEASSPAPGRQKLISTTRSAVRVAQIDGMLVAGRNLEVMDLVPKLTDSALPDDPFLAARMLKLACHAAAACSKAASAGGTGTDLAALRADWPRYRELNRCMQKMLPVLRNHAVDGDLRAGCQYLAGVMAGVSWQASRLAGGGAELERMGADADRAFADLYEPWIDDRTPADNILFCANKLWAVDARERAARLSLAYQAILDRDQELQSFRKEPKPLLDRYGAAMAVRAEFRKPWDEIVDLSYDPPDWLKLYNDGVPAEKMPPGVHADYRKALAAVAAFRATSVAAQKPVMDGGQFKAVEAALNGLERLLSTLASDLMVHRHLARYYRESGQSVLALQHFAIVFAFDSRDPEAQLGIIDATRRKMVAGPVDRAEIAAARQLAARLRDSCRTSDKVGYWEAEILVMEFSLGLGDSAAVDDTLAFMHRNRSDLSRDLVAPRIDGDDPRIRRAPNAQAAELARRFLALYARPGIGMKPEFRIDMIEAAGKAIAIYAEVDAPEFTARARAGQADGEVQAIIPVDAPRR